MISLWRGTGLLDVINMRGITKFCFQKFQKTSKKKFLEPINELSGTVRYVIFYVKKQNIISIISLLFIYVH